MKILLAYNRHRHGGGSDVASHDTAACLREAGHDVLEFVQDSKEIGGGFAGRWTAFVSGVYAARALTEFSECLERFRPDVVHIGVVYPLLSPWIFRLCKERGYPVVHTCHDFYMTCPISYHYRHGEICELCSRGKEWHCALHRCKGGAMQSMAYSFRSAVASRFHLFTKYTDIFITPTGFARDWLVEHAGLNIDQFRVVPYRIHIPEKAADPGTGAYVGFAGRFVEEKGIQELLRAAECTGFPFQLAGDSSTMPQLILPDNVRHVGMLDFDAMQEFLRGARLLVMPSKWFETFGIVAGEALAMGVPVVASRIGALKEVVRDGASGLHVTPGDPEDLADKIRFLWDHPSVCVEYGREGRKWIKAHCEKSVFVDNTLKAYQRAVHVSRKKA